MKKIEYGLVMSLALLSSLMLYVIKYPVLAGSAYASFSGINGFGPLCGLLGIAGTTVLFFLRAFMKGFIFGVKLTPLTIGVPTWCAAWYLKTTGKLKIMLPLLCIVIFLMHPVGQQAWFYSLYWFIPVMITLLPINHFFFLALASTFTAHAVGAVLWLYWYPMTVESFVFLMPIVPIERLLFASSMTLIYYSVQYCLSLASRFYVIASKRFAAHLD